MIQSLVVLGGLALLANFVRGITGAASSIVFNAAFLILYALDATGSLTLHDGLYWIALTNTFASALMMYTLRGMVRAEKLTVLFLVGTLPVNMVFSVVLTRVDAGALAPYFAAMIVAVGIHLGLRAPGPSADPRTLEFLAAPVGMLAGLSGGLFGMAGPVSFVLFSRASREPSLFRARLTFVSFTTNVVRLAVLMSQGVYTQQRLALALGTVPAIVCGVLMGSWVHRFVTPGPFRVWLGGLIGLTGSVALVQFLVSG